MKDKKNKEIYFSVIMPTWNRKHCIKNAIDSLFAQTYQNFELIIIDDGSTDRTADYIKELYSEEIKKRKIKFIRLEENKGAPFARNKGLKIVKGDWIAYLDTDNTMVSEYLETYKDSINKNINYKVFYAQIKKINSQEIIGHHFNFDELVLVNFIDMGIFVHSIEVYKELGGFDPEIKKVEDWDLIIKYTQKYKPVFIEKVLLNYYDGSEFYRVTNDESYNNFYQKIIINYYNRIPSDEFEGEYKKYYNQASVKDLELNNLNEIVQQKDQEIENKNNDIKINVQETENIKQIISQKDQEINALRNSTSWKITKPIRFIKDKIIRFKELLKLSYLIFRKDGFLILFKKIIKFTYKKIKFYFNKYLIFIKNKFFQIYSIIKRSLIILKRDGIILFIKRIIRKIEKEIIINNYNSENIAISLFNQQQNEFSEEEIKSKIDNFPKKPLISIIMPVYNTPPRWLRLAIDSLIKQVYENWELCVVDDFSNKEDIRIILDDYSKSDLRIKVIFSEKNSGISNASNIALNMAKGEYIAFLDHDDELTSDALFWVVNEINNQNDVDFIYTDECRKNKDGELVDFSFKPDWSPEYLLNDMYTSHLSVYSKNIINLIGGFRQKYDFSQDYDLVLRITEKTEKIKHIERVLYFWRQSEGSVSFINKDSALQSNIFALEDAMLRRGIKSKIMNPAFRRVKIKIPNNIKVSIVIPSDSFDNLNQSINSILKKTTYKNYEIIVVTRSDIGEKIKNEFFGRKTKVIISEYNKLYNFSDKCNQGSKDSNGDILIFYNDDVFPINPDWIDNLIEFLLYDEKIGGVSPKLLYENDKIQYAGTVCNAYPFFGKCLDGKNKNEIFSEKVRNISILNGSCFSVRKEVFEKISGFDSVNTPTGHSDVDLSFRLRDAGYRCVYTPYAQLHHMGNYSWHTKKDKSDIFVLGKWGKYISYDPYYTRSMRYFFDGYSLEKFNIYSKLNKIKKYKYDALLVTHELSYTGAPMVLLYAAKCIKKDGGFPVIFSYQDGPLLKEFEKNGIPVIVNEIDRYNSFNFKFFAKNFDLIIANTAITYPVVYNMQEIVPTMWWIHEGQYISECIIYCPPTGDIPSLNDVLIKAKNIFVVSEYAKKAIGKYNKEIKILKNGFADKYRGNKLNLTNKLQFSIIGTIEMRKAQDLFIDSIINLPIEYRKKAMFNIIGNDKSDFADNLKIKSRDIPEIIWHGLIKDENKRLDLFEETSVFVCISRDDPAPLVVSEGAMMGRPSILSENVGTNNPIENKISGFVIRTGDSKQLTKLFIEIIENKYDLIKMGEISRLMFLKNSTEEIFEKNLLEIIHTQILKSE